jgi:hypothetical protein
VSEERETVLPLLALLGSALVLWLVFWVFRHPPPDYDCGDKPAGQDALLADYRAGMRVLHVALVVVLAGTLTWAAHRRALARGGTRPGTPTLIAAAIALLWAAACLIEDGASVPLLILGFFAFYAAPLVALAAVAVLLITVADRRESAPRWRWRWPVVAGLGWFAVFLLIPGHAAHVLLQGDPICLG